MTDARNIAMLVSPATSEFCRRARRLRHVHRHDPVVLHRALRELRPATRVEAHRIGTVGSAQPTATFAGIAGAQLTGPVLSYSQRQELLRIAARLGIGRFEANLIIASVQHRGLGTNGERVTGPLKRALPGSGLARRAARVGAFLLVQSAIVLAIWSLLAM